MLILQRKAGESLTIGENIQLTVVSVDSGRVRLAITAPADVTILRSELVTAAAANVDSAGAGEPKELISLLGGVMERKGEDGPGAESKDPGTNK